MSMYQCFICDQMFKFGPDVYEGRPVLAWGEEMVCRRCERDNLDGIVPTQHLEDKLREKGIKIEYNAKGYIVIPL
jgi:hypothetical protein